MSIAIKLDYTVVIDRRPTPEDAENLQTQIANAKHAIEQCVNLFDTWDGKPTKEQSEIQTNLLSELEDASVKVTLIPTTFYQILVENIFKDWKHLQAKTHKQYEDKQKEHTKESEKGRMDSDMYEAQIEENKTMMQKVQAEEDQRKELQNKVIVQLREMIDAEKIWTQQTSSSQFL